MEGGRDIAPTVNLLLAQPAFVLKVATQDWHPASHVSFAANHEGKRAFVDKVLIRNPAEAKADDDNNDNDTAAAITPKTTTATTTAPMTDEARLWPVHCVQGTAGAALVAELDTTHVQRTVHKGTDARVEMYSPFRDPFGGNDTGLAGALRAAGATAVFVVGLAADYCVAHCAADAAREGFAAYIVAEATRPVDPAAWPRVRRELEDRDGVVVVSLDDPVVQRLITTTTTTTTTTATTPTADDDDAQ